MREAQENRVKTSPMQLALREWQRFWRSRTALTATLAAGLLLGVAAPFDTDDHLRLVPRLAYWTLIAFAAYLTGAMAHAALRPQFPPKTANWLAMALICFVMAGLISVEILVLNALVFGFVPPLDQALILFANTYVVSLIVAVAAELIGQQSASPTRPAEARPRLLDRLPHAKRGALISLSAVDHYVEVTTTAGSDLVLMRLSDAMAEAEPTEGLQIHRSHWVATGQVVDALREDGKTLLVLSDNRRLPVSRSNLGAAKTAGLIPG
jgi:hypothetical protein